MVAVASSVAAGVVWVIELVGLGGLDSELRIEIRLSWSVPWS